MPAGRLLGLALVLLGAGVASAHPPYEVPERVMTDRSGRTLHVARSYVDGIFFTDPVKLVVRDEKDQVSAATEYERSLALVCPRPSSCWVFQYSHAFSVLPSAWRLEDGRLAANSSRWLLILGVVAPLWDAPLAYLFATLTLLAPFAMPAVSAASPRTRTKTVLLILGSTAIVPYLGIWFYTVAALSSLSLPVVAVMSGISVYSLRRLAGAASRYGVPAALRQRTAAVVASVALGLFAAVIAGFVGIGSWVAWQSSGVAFEDVPVRPPLVNAHVTRRRGVVVEVFARLSPEVRLDDVVNLSLFDGFDASMARDAAERRIGPPSSRWEDPAYGMNAIYYERPEGRVSLVRQGPSWSTVGYPRECRVDYVLKNRGLRDQILQLAPVEGAMQVNILRSNGPAGLTVNLRRGGCAHLILTARDSDPR